MELPYRSFNCVIHATERGSKCPTHSLDQWVLTPPLPQGVLQCLSHILSSGHGVWSCRTITSCSCWLDINDNLFAAIHQTKVDRWACVCIINVLTLVCMCEGIDGENEVEHEETAPLLGSGNCSNCQQRQSNCLCDFPINQTKSSS